MKALVYEGPEVLTYRDFDDPAPAEGECLIEIEAVGICGSDMHAYLGHDDRRPPPLILGHEGAGTVIEGPLKGKRVTINPLVTSPTSRASRQGRSNLDPDRQIISMPPRHGAFAQRVSMPVGNLVEIPEGFDVTKASLAEPVACGWHAVRVGFDAAFEPPQSAYVFGGGAIGVGAVLSLKAFGCEDVIVLEPNAARRGYLAAQLGFEALDPADLSKMPERPFIIDGVGFEATRAAASGQCCPGGVIMHIGLGSGGGGLDIRRMTLQEITFIGTYTYTHDDFIATAEAMFDGRLGALDWTEHRSLADGAQAFADIRAGQVLAPKIILDPLG